MKSNDPWNLVHRGFLILKINPKIFIPNEDFALRSDEPIGYQTLTSLWDRHEVTKTLRIKVLSGADDEYQHGDLKRRSINPDIENERFNIRKSFLNLSFSIVNGEHKKF